MSEMARLKNHQLSQAEQLVPFVPGAGRQPGCGCCMASLIQSTDRCVHASAMVYQMFFLLSRSRRLGGDAERLMAFPG